MMVLGVKSLEGIGNLVIQFYMFSGRMETRLCWSTEFSDNLSHRASPNINSRRECSQLMQPPKSPDTLL